MCLQWGGGGGEAGPGGERTSAVASRQLRAPAVDTAASGHSVTRHSRAAASVNTLTTLNIVTLETEPLSGSMHERIVNHHIYYNQLVCRCLYICRLDK